MADIRDAFAKFEQDDLVGARADLKQIFRQSTNDYLKNELELSADPIVVSEEGDGEDE